MSSQIIVVDENVSLEPYLKASKQIDSFEAQLEKMGFEVQEEKPKRKIGFRLPHTKEESK
tara:strand:- start:675 stop:854 length:180 start_codon:yes stop_codon:yes gene_type:complete